MAQIVWTEPALLSLEGIADLLSLEDATAARDLVRKTCEEVERLADLSNSGQQFKTTRHQAAPIPPIEIIHRHEGKNLIVVGISQAKKPSTKPAREKAPEIRTPQPPEQESMETPV